MWKPDLKKQKTKIENYKRSNPFTRVWVLVFSYDENLGLGWNQRIAMLLLRNFKILHKRVMSHVQYAF
jgi:hypothetical protein